MPAITPGHRAVPDQPDHQQPLTDLVQQEIALRKRRDALGGLAQALNWTIGNAYLLPYEQDRLRTMRNEVFDLLKPINKQLGKSHPTGA